MSSAIERGGGHMYYAFSAVVSFFCVAIALVAIIINSINLKQKRKFANSLIYLTISTLYALTVVKSLVEQSSGIACAATPTNTLLVYGGLALVHIFFVWDSIRQAE